MYRLISALLAASDWLRLRHNRVHVCEYLPDWLDPDDYRCWCGARPNPHVREGADTHQVPAPAAHAPTPKKRPRP